MTHSREPRSGYEDDPLTKYIDERRAALAASREPRTRHGRYVLTLSRLHNWAAFDATDILFIEEEAAARAEKEWIADQLRRGVAPSEVMDGVRARHGR